MHLIVITEMRDAIGLDASDERIAYALLRVAAGVNLLMHGVSRMLAGPANFAGKLVDQFAMTRLPPWSVWGFGLVLPSVEMRWVRCCCLGCGLGRC